MLVAQAPQVTSPQNASASARDLKLCTFHTEVHLRRSLTWSPGGLISILARFCQPYRSSETANWLHLRCRPLRELLACVTFLRSRKLAFSMRSTSFGTASSFPLKLPGM